MPQFTKVTARLPKTNDEVEIDYKSFTDKLSLHEIKTEKTIHTSRETILTDLIKCLELFTKQESREITIQLKADEFYQPKLLIKTWTVKKEYYGK